MKTKHLIIILSLMSFGVANSFAQFKPIFPGCADTSKLENFSQYLLEPSDPRMPRPKRKHYSDEEIQNLYYQGEVFMTPENGSIDVWRDFQNYKKVSYPVKNNETINKVLPDSEMLYEYLSDWDNKPYSCLLTAKYGGKIYFSSQFNYLLENMGLNECTSPEDKIHCLVQWFLWADDPNIVVLELTKTFEQLPYDTVVYLPVKGTNEIMARNAHVDYWADYFGRILYKGYEMELYATIIGDKKFIRNMRLFEPGTKGYKFDENTEYAGTEIPIGEDNYNYDDGSKLENLNPKE